MDCARGNSRVLRESCQVLHIGMRARMGGSIDIFTWDYQRNLEVMLHFFDYTFYIMGFSFLSEV